VHDATLTNLYMLLPYHLQRNIRIKLTLKTSMLMISLQDVPIAGSQQPELLPLDLQAELYLRSDRTAIAYRKWLRELGLTFGTA
jgi:hypothetical protein